MDPWLIVGFSVVFTLVSVAAFYLGIFVGRLDAICERIRRDDRKGKH